MWIKVKKFKDNDISVNEYGEVRNDKNERCYTEYNSRQGTYVKIREHNMYRKVYVDELIIEAFLGPSPSEDDYEIEHIDGDITNNHIDNLRWKHRSYKIYDPDPYRYRPIMVNETGQIFSDIYACSKALGITTKAIKACLKSSYVTTNKGYTFKFVDQEGLVYGREI